MNTQQASPVWKANREPNKYRLNDLYNRFRSLALEMSGYVVSEPDRRNSKKDALLEQRIVDDFVAFQETYMKGGTS